MSSTVETRPVPRVQGPKLEFHTRFPVVHISEAETALFERFQAVGNLASVASFMTEHDASDGYPRLGVLNARFKVLGHPIDLTPMGASDEALLGYFDLARLHHDSTVNSAGEAARRLLEAVDVDLTGIGYLALERKSNKGSGFGICRYLGKVAAFDRTPKDSDLMDFAGTVVNTPQDFPVARFDTTNSVAHSRRIFL